MSRAGAVGNVNSGTRVGVNCTEELSAVNVGKGISVEMAVEVLIDEVGINAREDRFRLNCQTKSPLKIMTSTPRIDTKYLGFKINQGFFTLAASNTAVLGSKASARNKFGNSR